MCLGGIRGSKSARRIGGRVSSDTYLAPQFDPTKTPRIEDYLQPSQAGYGHSSDKDPVPATKTGLKPEYGPYWGYSDDMPNEDDFVSIEFPRMPPGARKSFSELLIETDTLEQGPLALAAMAAAAERAARLKGGSATFPGFQTKEGLKVDSNQKVGDADAESPAQSMSTLSKEHSEASKVVAAFKESRRQQAKQELNPSYIGSFFRSSRKRAASVPLRTRPLSPVPEVDRKSVDTISSTIMDSFSCDVPKSSLEVHSEDWEDYVLVESTPEPETIQQDESSIDGRIILEEDVKSEAAGTALQDDATSSTSQSAAGVFLNAAGVNLNAADCEEDDSQLLRTPARDILVTPEVFISPKTTSSSEYNFLRVNDMDPEERPIFGSLADHWEAALTTKRPVWDGRGILNDTNKYREDQKVMWHAVPFEERLAQALATHEDPGLQRRSSFKTSTSRLSGSRSSRSLRAH